PNAPSGTATRTESASRGSPRPSAALRVTAVQASHAAVEHHGGGRVAFAAKLRTFREIVAGERVLLPRARLAVGALLRDHLALLVAELARLEQPDLGEMPLDDVAELRDDRRHELAARLPIPAARIEHRLELVDEKRDVAA